MAQTTPSRFALLFGSRIARPVLALVCLPFLAVGGLTALVLGSVDSDLRYLRSQKATGALEMSLTIAREYHARAEAGMLPEATAQARALELLRTLRYDDGAGYVTITDDSFVNRMHPTLPSLEGRFVRDFQTVDGRFVVQEATELGRRLGSGILEYPFENTETGAVETKTSAIARFDPWGWTFYAGVFDEEFAARLDETRRAVAWIGTGVAALLLVLAAALGVRTLRAIRALTDRMERLGAGDLAAPIPLLDRRDELGDAARALAEFRENARQLVAVEAQLRTALGGARAASDIFAQEAKISRKDLAGATIALDGARREAQRLASHDDLTGLLNRRGLFGEIARCRRAAPDDAELVVAAVDLDGFKGINDTMGHGAGDAVLREVAMILRDEAGAGALVARTGGDEFVVAAMADMTDLAAFAERIVERLRQPVAVDNREMRLGASVGLASAVLGREGGAETVLVDADIALHEAKRLGKGRVAVFDRSLRERTTQTKRLADEIALALERDEFEPFFQTQRDPVTGAIVGAEALVRWRHPERGILAPAAFLEVAEHAGHLDRIDLRVMQLACETVRRCEAQGTPLPKLGLNVSMQRLMERDFLASLQALPAMGTTIALEIVEAVFFDRLDDGLIWAIDAAREAGFRIEVDDFGTGHASITALMRLGPDGIKIDRELVRPLDRQPDRWALLSAVVQIGQTMRLHITAEGVETADQVAKLHELGVDALQGFHFDRPMPAQDFLRLMAEAAGIAALPRSG